MNDKMIDFLEEVINEPRDFVRLPIREEAANLLADAANAKLNEAGIWGSNHDRWWDGFFTSGRKPSVAETAKMKPGEIMALVVEKWK